jgi:hypothetical protein
MTNEFVGISAGEVIVGIEPFKPMFFVDENPTDNSENDECKKCMIRGFREHEILLYYKIARFKFSSSKN